MHSASCSLQWWQHYVLMRWEDSRPVYECFTYIYLLSSCDRSPQNQIIVLFHYHELYVKWFSSTITKHWRSGMMRILLFIVTISSSYYSTWCDCIIFKTSTYKLVQFYCLTLYWIHIRFDTEGIRNFMGIWRA